MFANVRLVTDKDLHHGSRLYLNGNDISDNVRGVQVVVGCPPCIPEVRVSLYSAPFEYNGNADVKYDFTPETLQEAAKIIRCELSKKSDWYEALVSSIKSGGRRASVDEALAIHYAQNLDLADAASVTEDYTARCIADMLIGLEEPL